MHVCTRTHGVDSGHAASTVIPVGSEDIRSDRMAFDVQHQSQSSTRFGGLGNVRVLRTRRFSAKHACWRDLQRRGHVQSWWAVVGGNLKDSKLSQCSQYCEVTGGKEVTERVQLVSDDDHTPSDTPASSEAGMVRSMCLSCLIMTQVQFLRGGGQLHY